MLLHLRIHPRNGHIKITFIYYHDNGNKISEEHFKDGVRNGASSHWYDDGIKEYEDHYKDGMQVGISTRWYEKGKKRYEDH